MSAVRIGSGIVAEVPAEDAEAAGAPARLRRRWRGSSSRWAGPRAGRARRVRPEAGA